MCGIGLVLRKLKLLGFDLKRESKNTSSDGLHGVPLCLQQIDEIIHLLADHHIPVEWTHNDDVEIFAKWEKLLSRRGPDHFERKDIQLGPSNLSFLSSVLHLRGNPVQQPLSDNSGNVMLWNGEIFGGIPVDIDQNDGQLLFNRLTQECTTKQDILSTFNLIEGPWAMVFYHKLSETIYFGRDPLGRRSLMVSYKNMNFSISTLAVEHDTQFEWIELPTTGLYSIQLPSITSRFINGTFAFHPYPAKATRSNSLLSPKVDDQVDWDALATLMYEQLKGSVERRLVRPDPETVGVLFSGGIDSTVLAGMVGHVLPDDEDVDLINVAFSSTGNFDTPDRRAGLDSYYELCETQPNRKWNLVLVNVSVQDLCNYRPYIHSLNNPCDTLMDITIGCALWFASKADGYLLNDNGTLTQYVSKSKILLVGSGADEQLAGYSRHRTSYNRGGWPELQNELDIDMNRLWKRNLGRDDRTLSDHGRETRQPFLDEQFSQFLLNMPLYHICDMEEGPGIGDKKILRVMAKNYFKFDTSTKLAKRAIQFGSRIAKQFKKGKGTDTYVPDASGSEFTL
eukprot:TRINITY_DN5208_c0_g1_i3.p1 TRINITY_DN5208_c0_g1~~TRINITY_DN5208_c0_g1_i3.p1  ORF type:complete len:566 (-),score=130.31 TRINITY_DN5208_c0_g1_i3:151-1848(-)